MNIRSREISILEEEPEKAVLSQQELLELTRQLDHLGRRFERFMSMQLQQLEVAINDFHRERDAWSRQRRFEEQQNETRSQAESMANSDTVLIDPDFLTQKKKPSHVPAGDASAPLRMLIRPGTATAMQMGLLLFEISKFNRELRGGGVRFDVSGARISKEIKKNEHVNHSVIIGFEAFSCVPLLAYDGPPTQQLKNWDQFKSEILLSSLIDQKLQKEFRKCIETNRDHESRELALEATRRADNANSKCDLSQERSTTGFFTSKKTKFPANQQIQRVEDVARYLKNECGLRIHLALVW